MAVPGPRLRCALIHPDADGLPFALERPIHTLRFPPGKPKDYRPSELSLYTQLENATGSFHFWIELRNEKNELVNPNAPLEWVTFPATDNPVIPFEREFKVDITFPSPGVYCIHLMCDGRSLHSPSSSDDQPFPPIRITLLAPMSEANEDSW